MIKRTPKRHKKAEALTPHQTEVLRVLLLDPKLARRGISIGQTLYTAPDESSDWSNRIVHESTIRSLLKRQYIQPKRKDKSGRIYYVITQTGREAIIAQDMTRFRPATMNLTRRSIPKNR